MMLWPQAWPMLRQRVVLGEDGQVERPAPGSSQEGGRHPGHAARHIEAAGRQRVGHGALERTSCQPTSGSAWMRWERSRSGPAARRSWRVRRPWDRSSSVVPHARSSAWMTSATRSSGCSMPTLRRTRAGETSSVEPATEPWVMTAGTSQQRLDAAERLRQAEDAASPRRSARARSAPDRPSFGAGSKESMPPAQRHLACGQSRLRVRMRPVRQAGVAHDRDVRARGERTRRRPGRSSVWRSMRSARVRRPRRTRKQSNGPGTAPMAFCRNPRRSWRSARDVARTPLTTSEWPARYLVAEW